MGFLSQLKRIGSVVGDVAQKASRVVGSVANAIDSPIGRVITSVGSKIPVVGSAFSWARDLAPKVAQGADFIDKSIQLAKDTSSAVQNRDLSQAGDLFSRGQGLFGMAKGLRG